MFVVKHRNTMFLCSTKYGQKVSVFCIFLVTHVIQNEKCWGRPTLLMDIGPPCAPWCTTQVSGAQHRPVADNVVLYYTHEVVHNIGLTNPDKETDRQADCTKHMRSIMKLSSAHVICSAEIKRRCVVLNRKNVQLLSFCSGIVGFASKWTRTTLLPAIQ